MGTDIHGVFQARIAGVWTDIPHLYEMNRHYQLFAVLAGVRNGYGFAGVPTGDAIEPISEPRGLPSDFEGGVSHPISSLDVIDVCRRKYRDADDTDMEIWMGDHSYSWLTGQEMLDWYDRAPIVTHTGVIGRQAFAEWDGKRPSSYSGGVTGDRIKVVDRQAAEAGAIDFTHVQVSWQASLAGELAYFFDEVRRLVAEHGEIRFVFGFDN